MILTSIDPGKCPGWAAGDLRFDELRACGINPPALTGTEGDLVIEKPQIYRATKSKGDPNDLIEVAIMVGRYAERCPGIVTIVTPAEWKGQVPKNVHHKRVLAALRPEELEMVKHALKSIQKGDQHNALDAVGLWLWKVGRLGRGGI